MEKTHQQTYRLTTATLAGFVLALSMFGRGADPAFAASEDEQVDTTSNNDPSKPDRTDPLDSVTADAHGDFRFATAPPGRKNTGPNELTAVDTDSGETTTAAVAITETPETTSTPELVVDPTSTTAGEAINVSGTHFATGNIEIELEGELLVEAHADDDGTFSTIIQLTGNLEAGEYVLTAYDENGREATAQLTVSADEDASRTPELGLTTNTTEVQVGDTIRLRLEGPEELLAEHSTNDGSPDVTPHSELTNTIGQRGVFTETGPTLVDSGDGYHIFEYQVPAHQPTNNVFDDVGAITHGVYFTFFTTVDSASSTENPEGTSITSNEITIVVNETSAQPETAGTPLSETDAVLILQPEELELRDFVGDPEEGAGVLHRVEDLTPGTQVHYTISGPANVEVLTQDVTADEAGTVEFRVHGFASATRSVYLGTYTTAITVDGRSEQAGELANNFTVTGQTPTNEAQPPGQLEQLGVSLATTDSPHTMVLVLTGLLLIAGGAIAVYTNRARLFDPKDRV